MSLRVWQVQEENTICNQPVFHLCETVLCSLRNKFRSSAWQLGLQANTLASLAPPALFALIFEVHHVPPYSFELNDFVTR